MKHYLTALTAIGAFALAPLAQAQTLINFDDVAAPAFFSGTNPLTTQYAPQGATFSGGGTILNQGSNFGINAYSQPNFLAFNDIATDQNGTTPSGPETITFSTPATSVSLEAAATFGGGTVTLDAYNGAILVGTSSFLNTGSAYSLLSVSASNITSVVYSYSSTTSVADDLTFSSGASNVPEPGSVALLTSLGLTGTALLRRRRAR